MSTPLIRIRNITKIYGDGQVKTPALRGVSFDVQEGEFLAIKGVSGSGKSTLMHIIGFLDKPTSGEYYFEGEDTSKFSDDKLAELRNQKVGFIFQFYNLLPRTTLLENVLLPTIYTPNVDHEQKKKRAKELLEKVGLSHRADYYPNKLSGGEQQRAAIIRALINNPKLILADEPTGNLDSKSGNEVMDLLQKLHREGNTIIMVTHEKYTAEHAQRILTLSDGKIIDDSYVAKRRLANHVDELEK